MTKSIMQEKKECLICKTQYNLQRHHIFEGSGRRKVSEAYGCWCWLCSRHHTGDKGVHFLKDVDLQLKAECQKKWESIYGNRNEFIIHFGRNYL